MRSRVVDVLYVVDNQKGVDSVLTMTIKQMKPVASYVRNVIGE